MLYSGRQGRSYILRWWLFCLLGHHWTTLSPHEMCMALGQKMSEVEYPKTWDSFNGPSNLQPSRDGGLVSLPPFLVTSAQQGRSQATKTRNCLSSYIPWGACCVTLHCNIVIPGALSQRSFGVFSRCSPFGKVNPVSDWPVSKPPSPDSC